MKRYRPAKRAMLTFYLLLAALGAASDILLYSYVSMLSVEILRIVSIIFWVLILLIALFAVPHYFIHAKVVLTKNEVAYCGGFITFKDDYMPISSIKSVSVIVTPLGFLTGFNFVIINALGARIFLPFFKKSDVYELCGGINELISERSL